MSASDIIQGKDKTNYLISKNEIPENVKLCAVNVNPFYTTTTKQEAQLSSAIAALCSSGELSKCKTMSTVDKILYCQKWVEHHVTYSTKGNTDPYYLTAHAAYYQNASDCRGYALLFYRLLREFNIPVRVVETGSHIWNIVYVDGAWYICDTSAENGTFLKGSNSVSMSKVVNYDLILLEKSQGFQDIINCVSKTDHPSAGTYKTKNIVINHTVVTDRAKAATVFSTGLTAGSHCSGCHAVLKAQKKIAALKPTIKLSATKQTIKKKKSYTLVISKLATGDYVRSVTTGNKKIATVKKSSTNKYKITGVKKGKVNITVTLASGKKATVKVTVK